LIVLGTFFMNKMLFLILNLTAVNLVTASDLTINLLRFREAVLTGNTMEMDRLGTKETVSDIYTYTKSPISVTLTLRQKGFFARNPELAKIFEGQIEKSKQAAAEYRRTYPTHKGKILEYQELLLPEIIDEFGSILDKSGKTIPASMNFDRL